jgi:murein DD-endopeptidase MepM/ murein hydrolase activator NlpD
LVVYARSTSLKAVRRERPAAGRHGAGRPNGRSRHVPRRSAPRYYGRSSGGGFHNGIDFDGKVGEPILAAAEGVINHQGWYFNYGRTVKISHADNFETLYAHMSRFAPASAGQPVKKGEVIGYIGSTGRSTGPHLHFSIVDGQFVDPMPYFGRGGPACWRQSLVASASGSRTSTRGEGQRRARRGEAWSQNPSRSHN